MRPSTRSAWSEIYAQSNCKAFSVKDNKEVECTAKSIPAMTPTGTAGQ